eukprot:CAMPEP_0118890626 /NCGR_PEP_ID=MMETSP1166-20130328/1001_1 /TAXON_ID=1104430 /ORGANISM="Chrysoreinhardia sp, Strain CCMP3193" /LENGTH=434 /DNA_ID=CAMNT_0006829245 /DNA_START=42 /DNA_END=1342 /DNA_ORIENTATION=-
MMHEAPTPAPPSKQRRNHRRPKAAAAATTAASLPVSPPLPPPPPEGGGGQQQKPPQQQQQQQEPKKKKAHMTTMRFAEVAGVSPKTLRAVNEVLKYDAMTKVQAETLPVTCEGSDVVAKAKTGTGKTLAFVIPCVERGTRSTGQQQQQKGGLSALVLSPTRELAKQTYEEGRLVASNHDLEFACVVGGTQIKKDYGPLKRCDVLVATPGRLVDHLENTEGFQEKVATIKTLVFDECDQLLDAGFRPAIETILKFVEASKPTRQTLLFSATLPRDVHSIARRAMRPGYRVIDTVEASDDPTHSDVPQVAVVSPDARRHSDQLAASLAEVVTQAAEAAASYKIIVFFQTARQTQMYFELFSKVKEQGAATELGRSFAKTTFLEIHSRKSQTQREKMSKIFRDATTGHVLLTSDVSARGMDYPDVTLVAQFGAPADA